MINILKITGWVVLLTSMIACSTQRESIEKIEKLEIELYSNSKTMFNPQTAENLVSEYEAFITAHPKDSLAAPYLFKGAEVSMGMGSSYKAIELYKRVYTEYPDYVKAPTSLFLIGFVNETQLKNLSEAQKYYRKFIAEFPAHTLIKDAKFSLSHLGKSDEDIIKEFEAKNAGATQ
ncbi:MAG: tetratricopeptide repeat protein [Flavobacteriales bacterium]|nr:tetratricopeptide repeat protein [Flavobacteriales bacterium]